MLTLKVDDEYQDPYEVIDDLRALLKSRQQQVRDLSSKNNELIEENDRLSDDVRLLQEKSFNSIDDARWMPLDVSTITGELNMIRDSISQLAKKYAAKEFVDLEKAPTYVRQDLRSYLRSVVRFDKEEPDDIRELVAIKHAPRLCLTALISAYVHWKILSRPFFSVNSEMLTLLGTKPATGKEPEQQRQPAFVLHGIYSWACDCE